MGRFIKNRELKSGSHSIRLPIGTTILAPNDPVTGLFRFNHPKSRVEVYRSNRWVPLAFAPEIDYPFKETFYGTGTQVVFGPMRYKYPKNNEIYVRIYVHNVFQNPGVAYTIDDYSITFTSPPPDGHAIVVMHGTVPGDVFEPIPITWNPPPRIFTETSYRIVSNLPKLIEFDSNTAQFTVTTTNVADGTELFWRVRPGNIPVTDLDFVLGTPGNLLTGSFRIQSNMAKFNVEVITDSITEHDETFYVDVMTGNLAGTVVTTTVEYEIKVFDPLVKTYKIDQDLYLVQKGGTVNYTVNTTKVSNNTVLFYQFIADPANPITYVDIVGSNPSTLKTGTITIQGNTNTFPISTTYSSTDLGKRFYVQLRDTNTISGNIVANSALTSIGLQLFLGPF